MLRIDTFNLLLDVFPVEQEESGLPDFLDDIVDVRCNAKEGHAAEWSLYHRRDDVRSALHDLLVVVYGGYEVAVVCY
jgi:hypothetical protein